MKLYLFYSECTSSTQESLNSISTNVETEITLGMVIKCIYSKISLDLEMEPQTVQNGIKTFNTQVSCCKMEPFKTRVPSLLTACYRRIQTIYIVWAYV